ncbi:MAG: 2-C-methyl-D-erythritol 2,4-cyclodiphosphate synthase [Bacilli bacterium]|jgi:2-C-methyl-D-erythritol 2,4-cyclodiphosphate synthase
MDRIGYGEDIHQLVKGRKLVLGGIEIPFDKGLLGHSDADVVCHALADALLGALALGDIGQHFPDNDPQYKNADSTLLLADVYQLILANGYEINNIDLSISLERPHIATYLLAMRKKLCSLLSIALDVMSIKAMTNEGLDAVGRGEACRATAIVLLREK